VTLDSIHRHRVLRVLLCACLLLGLSGPLVFAEEGDAPADPNDTREPYTKGNPASAADLFDEGEAHRELGKWKDAADSYWGALEADLRHFPAHVRYQEVTLRNGGTAADMIADLKSFMRDFKGVPELELHILRLQMEPAARIEALTQRLKKTPKDFNALLELGRAQLAAGAPLEAVKPLQQAATLAPPARREIPLLLAEALIRTNELEKAREILDLGVAAKPDWHAGQLALARLAFMQADLEAALKGVTTYLELRPGTLVGLQLKAEIQSRNGDREGAMTTLAEARRKSEDAPDIAIAYADLLARDEAGLEGAVAIYKTVLEKDEENARARYGLGWALERQAKYEEAEEQYREVVAVQPTSVHGINSIGYCLFKQGRVSESQVQFKKAVDLDKTYVTAVLNLGATYDAQLKYGDAIKLYEKVLKDKDQKDNLRAIINCAFDHEMLGAFPKALKLLERAHKIVPDDVMIMVWVGDNHYFTKKYKTAEEWYEKAINKDKENFFAWRGLGYALGHRKKWEDAAKALENARKLNDKDLDILLSLGDIYLNETEDLQAAVDVFQDYVQRGGDDPAVPEIIVEIKKRLDK
jgi:tetratricopeptide (TPR) repeat protein